MCWDSQAEEQVSDRQASDYPVRNPWALAGKTAAATQAQVESPALRFQERARCSIFVFDLCDAVADAAPASNPALNPLKVRSAIPETQRPVVQSAVCRHLVWPKAVSRATNSIRPPGDLENPSVRLKIRAAVSLWKTRWDFPLLAMAVRCLFRRYPVFHSDGWAMDHFSVAMVTAHGHLFRPEG